VFYLNKWGLGIGDWGLGIGPNPQSPIPNPHILKYNNLIFIESKFINHKNRNIKYNDN